MTIVFRVVLATFLLVSLFSCSNRTAQYPNQTMQGYWIYGFETSLFESCQGERFWMWSSADVQGQYQLEGYRNPVVVQGYVLPPSPEQNMQSYLPEIKVIKMQLLEQVCD
ncbi:hypothetical protein [Agarivorans albus]|nr:hypothetical protein [Agarivorans albus]